jgi:hypothetical protein
VGSLNPERADQQPSSTTTRSLGNSTGKQPHRAILPGPLAANFNLSVVHPTATITGSKIFSVEERSHTGTDRCNISRQNFDALPNIWIITGA